MIRTLIVTTNPTNYERLVNALVRQSGLAVVGSGQDLLSAYLASSEAPTADLLLVDLDSSIAIDPRFWMTLHTIYPASKIVAIVGQPFDETVLQLALYAGVYSYVVWSDVEKALCTAALFVVEGRRFYSTPKLISVIQRLVMQLETGQIQITIAPQDLGKNVTSHQESLVTFSNLEREILRYLIQRRGFTVSHHDLLRDVWKCDSNSGGTTNQVKSAIKRLRRKIDQGFNGQGLLVTVRGQGYQLMAPDDWLLAFLPFISLSAETESASTISS